MNSSQKLRAIRESFGYSNEELSERFEISIGTLSNYKGKRIPRKRHSEASKLIDVLFCALKVIASHSGHNPKIELRNLRFRNLSFEDFVRSFLKSDSDLLKITVEEMIESQLKERQFERPLDKFKAKYDHLNDETLAKASKESPQLVEGIIVDEQIPPLARSHALYALAMTVNEDYFPVVRSYISHASPFIRECAFMGLAAYYDEEEGKHLELKELFARQLEDERASGVRKRIASLLESM